MIRIILLSSFALPLGASAFAQNDDDAQGGADYLSKPEITIRKGSICQCPDEVEDGVLILIGLVVDAEITLAADGISVNDRQASIFNINPSSTNDYKGRTKIWHSSNKAQCGMTFNYGAKYTLTVRKTEDGALETDACLMGQALEKATD